jgi:hypothetical protein
LALVDVRSLPPLAVLDEVVVQVPEYLARLVPSWNSAVSTYCP